MKVGSIGRRHIARSMGGVGGVSPARRNNGGGSGNNDIKLTDEAMAHVFLNKIVKAVDFSPQAGGELPEELELSNVPVITIYRDGGMTADNALFYVEDGKSGLINGELSREQFSDLVSTIEIFFDVKATVSHYGVTFESFGRDQFINKFKPELEAFWVGKRDQGIVLPDSLVKIQGFLQKLFAQYEVEPHTAYSEKRLKIPLGAPNYRSAFISYDETNNRFKVSLLEDDIKQHPEFINKFKEILKGFRYTQRQEAFYETFIFDIGLSHLLEIFAKELSGAGRAEARTGAEACSEDQEIADGIARLLPKKYRVSVDVENLISPEMARFDSLRIMIEDHANDVHMLLQVGDSSIQLEDHGKGYFLDQDVVTCLDKIFPRQYDDTRRRVRWRGMPKSDLLQKIRQEMFWLDEGKYPLPQVREIVEGLRKLHQDYWPVRFGVPDGFPLKDKISGDIQICIRNNADHSHVGVIDFRESDMVLVSARRSHRDMWSEILEVFGEDREGDHSSFETVWPGVDLDEALQRVRAAAGKYEAAEKARADQIKQNEAFQAMLKAAFPEFDRVDLSLNMAEPGLEIYPNKSWRKGTILLTPLENETIVSPSSRKAIVHMHKIKRALFGRKHVRALSVNSDSPHLARAGSADLAERWDIGREALFELLKGMVGDVLPLLKEHSPLDDFFGLIKPFSLELHHDCVTDFSYFEIWDRDSFYDRGMIKFFWPEGYRNQEARFCFSYIEGKEPAFPEIIEALTKLLKMEPEEKNNGSYTDHFWPLERLPDGLEQRLIDSAQRIPRKEMYRGSSSALREIFKSSELRMEIGADYDESDREIKGFILKDNLFMAPPRARIYFEGDDMYVEVNRDYFKKKGLNSKDVIKVLTQKLGPGVYVVKKDGDDDIYKLAGVGLREFWLRVTGRKKAEDQELRFLTEETLSPEKMLDKTTAELWPVFMGSVFDLRVKSSSDALSLENHTGKEIVRINFKEGRMCLDFKPHMLRGKGTEEDLIRLLSSKIGPGNYRVVKKEIYESEYVLQGEMTIEEFWKRVTGRILVEAGEPSFQEVEIAPADLIVGEGKGTKLNFKNQHFGQALEQVKFGDESWQIESVAGGGEDAVTARIIFRGKKFSLSLTTKTIKGTLAVILTAPSDVVNSGGEMIDSDAYFLKQVLEQLFGKFVAQRIFNRLNKRVLWCEDIDRDLFFGTLGEAVVEAC
ncbi:MAG: hypothetical protein HQ564_09860 [Candidatus Saganbacteria bacterium]|nr:hypothetical protein [Candidatus Saganbacteria bacterium]